MGSINYNLTINEKLVPYVCDMVDGNSVEEKAHIFMIIGMFAAQTISLEKAAEISGKTVWDFLDILRKYHIPWGHYTEDGAQLDVIALSKLESGMYE